MQGIAADDALARIRDRRDVERSEVRPDGALRVCGTVWVGTLPFVLTGATTRIAWVISHELLLAAFVTMLGVASVVGGLFYGVPRHFDRAVRRVADAWRR